MTHEFTATRIVTKGNLLFPDTIIVDLAKTLLVFKKRNWYAIGYQEVSVKFKNIVSFELITRSEWVFFSDISIQTIDGNEILANGFLKKDAFAIKKFVGF